MGSIDRMNSPAKFLVLLDTPSRAMLFDSQQRLVGEVIENDGFIVDSLLRSARQFAPPATTASGPALFPPSSLGPARCFELA